MMTIRKLTAASGSNPLRAYDTENTPEPVHEGNSGAFDLTFAPPTGTSAVWVVDVDHWSMHEHAGLNRRDMCSARPERDLPLDVVRALMDTLGLKKAAQS